MEPLPDQKFWPMTLAFSGAHMGLPDPKTEPVVLLKFGVQSVAPPNHTAQHEAPSDFEALPVAPPECEVQQVAPSSWGEHPEASLTQEQIRSPAHSPT